MDLLSLGSKAPRAERACTLDALLTPHTCRGIENTYFSLPKTIKFRACGELLEEGKVFSFLKEIFWPIIF